MGIKRTVAIVTACNPEEAQARQNPSSEKGHGHEVPLLAEELSVIDSYWEKESLFLLKMWPLLDRLHCSIRTAQTRFDRLKKGQKVGWVGK